MTRFGKLLAVAVVGISLAGCVSPQGRPDYTASGALLGGAIGGLGSDSGRGAIVGALIGGLLGHGIDQAQEEQLRAQAPQTLNRLEQSQPLTVEDIKALAKAGVSDDLVISQIRNSRTVYHLNTSEIIGLKNVGVSDRVIDFMINTPTQIRSAEVAGVVGSTPPAPIPEPIFVAPGPGYFWVAGVWTWYAGSWLWRPGYWHRPGYHPYPYGRPGFPRR